MNKFLATLLISFSLISFSSWAADFDKGFAAFQSKDYATALRELRPLAEQGDKYTQVIVASMYRYGLGVP